MAGTVLRAALKTGTLPGVLSRLFPLPGRLGASALARGLRSPRLILLLCWLLCLPSAVMCAPAWATANPLAALSGKKADAPQAQPGAPQAQVTAALSDEEIEASRAKLDARSSELRQQTDPKAITSLRTTYQEAATPQELDDWEKLTGKLAGILEDNSTTLFRYRNYRKATRDKLDAMKSWEGFSEKPPYPITLVDNLHDELNAKQSVLKSLDVIRVTIEGEFSEYSDSLKESRKKVRLAEEELEKNTGKPGEQRSRWLLSLAQLQSEVNQAGIVYGEARRLSVAELQKGIQAEIDFLNRKLAVARGSYRFSEEKLKQKIKDIDERLNHVRQLLEQSKKREKEARKQLDAAEDAVSKARATQAAGGKLKIPLEQLMKEQKRRQAQFEDASLHVLIYGGMSGLLKSEKGLWQERYRLAGGRADQDTSAELKNSRNELDLLNKWKSYITNKLSVIEFNIKVQKEALASADLAAGDREDARTMLALYQAQEALLQRGMLLLGDYEQIILRRDEEAKREQVTLAGRTKGAFATFSSMVKAFWFIELYVAEESIIVDNKIISRPRSVTVGKVVVAVLILVIGMWLVRRLKGSLQWLAMHRFKIEANEAHLYTRLLAYLLFIVVLISALVFVNIPLAVFTFLGGALAIGIGFGAQTLINNFISGLILMFDRTIRMGDVVEVDGHRGRVASIGMRSSSINRFDGVEMLVPNSVFLQQNVTNWTSSDPRARYSVTVGVAYGSPTREVEQIISKAVEDQQHVLNDPPPYVVFENFADSALTFTAYFWIELDPNVNSMVIFSDIRHRINERLAGAGISIPFPQRDLHLETSGPIEIKMVDPA